MKSRLPRQRSVPPVHLISYFLMASTLIVAGCGGGTSGSGGSGGSSATTVVTTPQPIAGDVERTTFAPSLNVDLSKMSRRASGLYVQDLRMGDGAIAARERTVAIKYIGWLPNGKQFDSGEISVSLGKNSVIRAWEEGLLGMRVGGIRRIVSPPNMAYGNRGAGNDIPPGAVLVFEMQMMSVY